MSRIITILTGIILSVGLSCHAAKVGTPPSPLVIHGDIGMQIDVENVQTNVPFNTFVDWIGLPELGSGETFIGSLALALISEDNEIKEILYEKKDLSLSGGYGFGQYQRFCNLKVTTDISDTDILRFITLERGDDTWLPVTSPDHGADYCHARGNIVRKSNIKFNILGANDIPHDGYCIGTSGETLQREPIYSSSYRVNINWPEGKDHHFIRIEPFNGRIQLEPDYILFQYVQYPEYQITLMACSDDELIKEQRHYNVTEPGSFGDQLKDSEERLYINNISVSGTINEADILFMRDEMPMLEHIDLSEAYISGEYLPDYAFDCKGIKSIILPNNIWGLGTNSLRKTKLTKLEIPENVEYYGLNALNYSEDLALVVLRNPNVIPVSWCVLEGTKREEGVLFVPKGTRDAFAADSEWGVFGFIVEGDNTDDWINDSDGTYNYSGLYPDVVVSEVVKLDAIMNIPETVELKGRIFNVTGIGRRVFDSFDIKEIYIPKSVIQIGEYAIESSTCLHLEKIEVDKENPKYFSNGGVLYDRTTSTLLTYPPGKPQTEYTVPEGITIIDGWACYNDYLNKITLPSTLEIIGSCAFCWSGLGYSDNPVIISKAANPPYIGPSAFTTNTYNHAKVYVPQNSLEAYKADEYWGLFLNIYPLEETGIEDVVMGDNEGAKDIEVYDLSGKLVYKGIGNAINLPRGIYILKANGKTKKMMF